MKKGLVIPEDLDPALKEQLAFRVSMTVDSVVFYSGGCHSYPLCPRCNTPIDRYYMDYCDRCGQFLCWRGIRNAKKIYRHPRK